MKILDEMVTQMKSCSNRNSPVPMTLRSFMEDNIGKHKSTIEAIRGCQDREKINYLKKTLPVCQLGITNGAGISGIQVPSTLMQIDIDGKDNPHISDLKKEVCNLPFICFAMYSASGRGLFVLIRIQNPKLYKSYFQGYQRYLKEGYNIVIDPAVSSPASLRFWSYDPSPFINENAKIWNFIPPPANTLSRKYASTRLSGFEEFSKTLDVEGLLIANGWKHQTHYDKGSKRRYTRPGKNSGVSADFCLDRRLLFVFSSSPDTGFPAGHRAYNPISVFCYLAYQGNWDRMLKHLKGMELGRIL